MNIKFKHIEIKNFLSLGEVSLNLSGLGYCVVKGVNNYIGDGALSNGSGKSSIFSAIVYALTGATIQGLKSNIVNINTEGGAYVKLTFSIDKDEYVVTRYREYGSIGNDLKIEINGEDKSGKGLRDSQALLEQYLPDLSTDLLGSVIVLGQGLPQRFSNHSPIGRKEVLEKLSRSDFMIQDLRDRVDRRTTELHTLKRDVEDSILKDTTQIGIYKQQLVKAQEDLENLTKIKDTNFNELIENKEEELQKIDKEYSDLNAKANTLNEQVLLYTEKVSKLTGESTNQQNMHKMLYRDAQSVLDKQIIETNQQIFTMEHDIKHLKGITDICPTCKQKIVGVEKPDTTEKEKELKIHQEHLLKLTKELTTLKATQDEELRTILATHTKDIMEAQGALYSLKKEQQALNVSTTLSIIEKQRRNLMEEVLKLKAQQESLLTSIAGVEKTIKDTNREIKILEKVLQKLDKNKDKILSQLEINSKMLTAIRRDFRGFLLSSVIEFISQKAKEYSQDVFGTQNIEFTLNGNNIDISYNSKAFENLSGGEKQRVDLILQFAIRDMMSQYLSFTSNILVLDEIFDNLDVMGTNNVLNLIATRLTDVESIFIVSHNDSLEIPYDNIITVTKDEKGVSRVI